MLVAWRLVRTKYQDTAFTGEGSKAKSGRWNSRDVALVYTSATLSLSALETLVHLPAQPDFTSFVSFEVDFSDVEIKVITEADLPADWRAEPAVQATRDIGDGWVVRAETAVLQVPSVIIPHEANYLLNPNHRAFKKIKIGKPQPFAFDPRLLERK